MPQCEEDASAGAADTLTQAAAGADGSSEDASMIKLTEDRGGSLVFVSLFQETVMGVCKRGFDPSHLRPVILKPVGRIFEISDSNPIQRKCGKCGRPSHPRKTRV